MSVRGRRLGRVCLQNSLDVYILSYGPFQNFTSLSLSNHHLSGSNSSPFFPFRTFTPFAQCRSLLFSTYIHSTNSIHFYLIKVEPTDKMKATFVTLIGFLAISVAATPLHPHVGVSIVTRADAKQGKDAKQDGKKKDAGKAGAADKPGAAKNGTAGAVGAAAGGNSTGPLVLPDGRIKKDAKPEDFNVLASVFKSAVVKGDGTSFKNHHDPNPNP